MKEFKNEFLEIVYDDEHNICIANWTEATEDAKKKDFKNWNREFVKMVELHHPNNVLINTLDYRFIVTTDLQEWSVSNVFQPIAKAGVRKIGVIIPLDLFPKISVQQLDEEYQDGDIERVFFTDLEEARTWLISSN